MNNTEILNSTQKIIKGLQNSLNYYQELERTTLRDIKDSIPKVGDRYRCIGLNSGYFGNEYIVAYNIKIGKHEYVLVNLKSGCFHSSPQTNIENICQLEDYERINS